MGILGFIFNLITTFRNYLYDKYILRINRVKDLRVVCVGNITVGGTGKTPADTSARTSEWPVGRSERQQD